jgi:hypothetical protein
MMKQVVIDRYGQPEDVARCADVADVGAPSPGELVFDVLAFPINPADISFCRGTYRLIYPIEDIRAALAHAQRGERSGKILVAPNGRL